MYNNKQEIIKSIEKRIQTTMIGALAKFEENFGHLWNTEEESEEAEKYWDIWEHTRNQILNNGNNQLRSALEDLGDYLYASNKKSQKKHAYRYKFYFNDGENRNEH
jgi:hypothetical protein